MDRRPGSDKLVYGRHVPSRRSPVQRSQLHVIDVIDVGPARNQRGDCGRMPVRGGVVQRGEAILVGSIDEVL